MSEEQHLQSEDLEAEHSEKGNQQARSATGEPITFRDLPTTHWSHRAGHQIEYVVIHGTDDPNRGTVHTTANYLRQNARGVSAHELVGGRIVYRMLDASKAAHTVGHSRLPDGSTGRIANQRTWNIEGQHWHGHPMDPVTRQTLLERVVERCIQLKWQRKEIVEEKRVLGHYEIDTRGKTCPGPGFFKQMDTIRDEIARLVEAKTANQQPTLKQQATAARWLSEDITRDIEGLLSGSGATTLPMVRGKLHRLIWLLYRVEETL